MLIPLSFPSTLPAFRVPIPRLTQKELFLEPSFPYGEDLLQFLWESRLFDGERLRTVDGRSVDVLKPGRIQRDSGPDLTGALLRIDGQLWAGNVEVHVRSSEWNAHGHQFDAAYDNVVLHVVYAYDSEVRTASGTAPATVEIGDRLHKDSLDRHHELMNGQRWVPCEALLKEVDPSRITLWLERLLVERLERKTANCQALYQALGNDPVETFHHQLLRGFGARVNADPFGMLAYALPGKVLRKYSDDPFRTEALLFGQAGLLPADPVDAYPRMLRAEHRSLARLHGLGDPVPLAAWKFGGVRPANFPTVRLAQLAGSLTQRDAVMDRLLGTNDLRALRNALTVEPSAYWRTHYRFDRAASPETKRPGRAAVDGLIINTIIPYLFVQSRLRGQERLAEQALSLLEQLPPERNAIVARWEALGLKASSAARSQALLELKTMYCTQRRCLFCVIGAELLKRPAR